MYDRHLKVTCPLCVILFSIVVFISELAYARGGYFKVRCLLRG